MTQKYKILQDVTMEHAHRTICRIQALKSFNDVKAGDLGGWVESEDNLSQEGNCWIYDEAKVYHKAIVSDNAEIHSYAEIFDSAKVYQNATIWGKAQIGHLARIYGNAEIHATATVMNVVRVYGNAFIGGNTLLHENAKVYGNAQVYDDTIICGSAEIYGNARVFGHSMVRGFAKVYRHAKVCEYAKVQGNAKVRGRARVNGYATISGDAIIESSDDYIVMRNNWSSGRYFTYTRSNQLFRVGCFLGTGDELIEKAYKDSQLSGDCYEASVLYVQMLEQAFAHNKQKQ